MVLVETILVVLINKLPVVLQNPLGTVPAQWVLLLLPILVLIYLALVVLFEERARVGVVKGLGALLRVAEIEAAKGLDVVDLEPWPGHSTVEPILDVLDVFLPRDDAEKVEG